MYVCLCGCLRVARECAFACVRVCVFHACVRVFWGVGACVVVCARARVCVCVVVVVVIVVVVVLVVVVCVCVCVCVCVYLELCLKHVTWRPLNFGVSIMAAIHTLLDLLSLAVERT